MDRRPLALAALMLLAGCGGGDEFTGAAKVPAGYTTYRGDGVSLAYPEGWQVRTRKDSDGGSSVQIFPRRRPQTPFPLILLTASPNGEKRFKTAMKGRRLVIEEVTKGKIESDDEVDVPGTKEARRLVGTVPPREGTDPVEVKSDSLDLLRDNGDTLTVIAAAPQREGDDELDPRAVVESVRLR